MSTKKLVYLGAGTAVFLVCAYILHSFFPLVENAFYDMSFAFSKIPAPESIVIVGVDSKSVSEGGGWPWPRSTMAQLVRNIESGKPKVLALDFLFPVREEMGPANDSLAAALAEVDNLILPFRAGDIYRKVVTGPAVIPQEALGYEFQMLKNQSAIDHHSFYYTKSIDIADPRFVVHAKRGGFLNVSTRKGSQKLREVIHVIRAGRQYFPSFALAVVTAFLDAGPEELALQGGNKPSVIIRDRKVPLTSYAGSLLLHYRGAQSTFRTVSAVDVLNGRVDPSVFAGKLVCVGITDAAIGVDFFITPVGTQFPGVEIWATAAADLLEGSWIRYQAGAAAFFNWLIVFALFPGLALFIPNRNKHLAVSGGVAVIAVSVVLWIVLFKSANVFWNPGYHVYAWIFSLLWLGLQKADPTLIEVKADDLEPSDASDADTVPPPGPQDFIASIPDCVTARHVAGELRSHGGSVPQPGSGTLVETDLLGAVQDEAAMVEQFRSLANGTIVKVLGSGGMADVYLVWNPRMEVYRAVKVIKPNMSDKIQERFETEIRIFANLSHRNIVQCFNAGDWHSLPYLEMEYVPGAALDSVLDKCKLLTPEQAIAAGILVCRALHYAHQKVVSVYGTTYKGVIHRDLKPANIILSRGGRIKLTDFGIARPQAVSIHTMDSTKIIGTLPYLAPEQLEGKELNARTDIYALGLTLYEMVTGERAFPQNDVTTLVNAKAKGQYKSLKGSGLVPAPLAAIIEKAVAQDPGNRYDSAQAMGRELERALHTLVKAPGSQLLTGLVKRFWG